MLILGLDPVEATAVATSLCCKLSFILKYEQHYVQKKGNDVFVIYTFITSISSGVQREHTHIVGRRLKQSNQPLYG